MGHRRKTTNKKKKKSLRKFTTALMTAMLRPAWDTRVEKAIPMLSPVLMYPNIMTQNEKKVSTVVCIRVRTSMNRVTTRDPTISNGNSFTKNEKKNDVELYPPSEISLYAISRYHDTKACFSFQYVS